MYASHKARLEIGTEYLPSSPKFTEMQQLTEEHYVAEVSWAEVNWRYGSCEWAACLCNRGTSSLLVAGSCMCRLEQSSMKCHPPEADH